MTFMMVGLTVSVLVGIVIGVIETWYTRDKAHGVFTGMEYGVKMVFWTLALYLAFLIGELITRGMIL